MTTVLFAILCGTAVAQVSPPPASEVQAAITRQGAKLTVDDLVKQGRWDGVSAQIAKGRREWLTLVPLLATGTDAGTSEDLGIDLALALPRNPGDVLTVVDHKAWTSGGIIGIQRVCGLPFIEDTQPHGYVRKAIASLSTVADPLLADNKRECLAELKKAGSDRR